MDFEAMYNEFYRDVYRYVLSLVKKPDEAEEITQETFTKAIASIHLTEKKTSEHGCLQSQRIHSCQSVGKKSMSAFKIWMISVRIRILSALQTI